MTTQPTPGSADRNSAVSPAHKYPPPPPPPTVPPPHQAAAYRGQVYGTPGYVQPPGAPQGIASAKPNAYWPLSIVALLLSLIFGAIGLYFSSQVGARWNAGDTEGAKKASTTALILDLIGIFIGFIVIVSSFSSS